MTIDDQIRDEKLQLDINREGWKISPLSSNKVSKYEYLTGEEILPSNINHAYDDEDSPLISKQKEIFNKLVDEKLDEITKLDEKVNLDDLIYRYKGKTPDENFDTYDNALNLIDKIKNGQIKLAEAKNDQIKFKSNLGETTTTKYQKSKKNPLYNIETLYKARIEAIKFCDNYYLMASAANNKARNEGKGLKILTPKQMLQRLPIALAKAGNNSLNITLLTLLNKIRYKNECHIYELRK